MTPVPDRTKLNASSLVYVRSVDLKNDSWGIFSSRQVHSFNLLKQEASLVSEQALAFIRKSESQEDQVSQFREQQSNNLLYNLTVVTFIMMPCSVRHYSLESAA